ncbi:hypothetical protein F2Q69_00060242 [Brassica cretica]|uniref:Uncharacterized protein n=1 Tax=Brassica cretica TaxID=69181 RepID=A0A8S9RA97_BRACR|nr:hypothetical protein F2Q69_00060242 [Brassica cretica]
MVAQRARIAALEVERDRDIRRASRIAHRDIAAKFREVLESLKDRWASKKKEMSTEIRLQEEWKETARILSPPPPCWIGRSPSLIFLKSQMIRWIKSGGRLSLMILFLSTFAQTRIQTVFALLVRTDRAPLVEESEDEAEHSQEVVATPSVQTQSSDRLTRRLVRRSSFRTFGSASRGRAFGKSPLISIHDSDDEDVSGENRAPVSLSAGSEDETVAATRKRRRPSEGALPGPSHPRFVSEGDVKREAYANVVVASSKVMEAFNEYVVTMEDHVVASRNESIGFEIKRFSKELEATKREGKKDAEKIEALTENWRRVHL